MFKRGFTLPNILALILGLCVTLYFTLAKDNGTQESPSAAANSQPGN
jgi:hypothetical protein